MELLKSLEDPVRKVLVVGPHPDDIEFSTGRLIMRRKGQNVFAVCMTDGRKGQEGTPAKKILPEDEYARVRELESTRALKELGIDLNNLFFMGIPDQELVFNPFVIDKLFMLFRKIRPDFILIPPWEGAHPDHDACHLFARIAAKNFEFQNIIEYGSYNNYGGEFHIQEFIPMGVEEFRLVPRPNEQKRWNDIMKIFRTQINQQKHYIPKSVFEVFRKVPDYDYTKLPYSTKQAEIIRDLLRPIYPLARKLIPNKDKMFYETWKSNIDPSEINKKLDGYVHHYMSK
ncbi:MAG: PIG-L family deacetylase [Candidatus Woesearchaeota archaeon]|nr:PIG-L family deacetylase [Candidatus Woesearchaeota archaeon]